MKIRTMIVDDELHAREGIKIRLKEHPNIQIVGECSSGNEAVASINSLKPDLLFLDIQMPEMNGFEVLQMIEIAHMPIVIFVTAYDKYALQAFDFHALDYLLKPINEDRFKEALRVALSEIHHRNLEHYANRLQSAVSDYLNVREYNSEEQPHDGMKDKKRYLHRLMVKSKGQILIIFVHEIDWIESAGDYIFVHSRAQKHIVRETLSSLEQKMDPQKFVRIHRSTIVNLEKIKTLRPNEHGDYDVYLQSGVRLKLSRTYRAHFELITGNPL